MIQKHTDSRIYLQTNVDIWMTEKEYKKKIDKTKK